MRFFYPLLLFLVMFSGGCARIFHRHPRVNVPSTKSDEAKHANDYLEKIDKYNLQLKRLDSQIGTKRTAGYNTSKAEEASQKVNELIRTCQDLTLERKFSELEQKLQEIEAHLKIIKNELSRATRFGDQPIKKEKVQRKYLDERDWVKELRGEPDSKSYRYPTTVHLSIFDATSILQGSKCWDPRMNQFVLQNPPTMESWYYQTDQKMYIFSEDNPILDQFLSRNELPAQQRDSLLVELCERQVNFGGLKLIYVGSPVADLSSIMEQVFTGRMRMAGMFGLEGMERKMRATSALPDLTIASIAFNTSFFELNKNQHALFTRFYELIKELDPEVLGGLVVSQRNAEFEKIYDFAKDKGLSSKFLEEAKRIRGTDEPDASKSKKISTLLGEQSKDFKKRREAVSKIAKWQQTLSTSEKDTKALLAIYPEKVKELEEVCVAFRDTLQKIAQEFGKVRKDLLKFRTQWTELSFDQNAYISVFFLLEGVRFEEKVLPNGFTTEEPDLGLQVIVKMMRGKKDPPLMVKETNLKIDTANRYIDEVKEYRRLASFGIVFPFRLQPGRYEVTLVFTDNLRVKTVKEEVVWQIVAEQK